MDGTIEGTIKLPDSRLTVGPNGHVMADMEARDIVIYGLVQGNIRASGRLELRESAEVKGDIHAERLSIEENASLKGRVELSELTPGPGSGRHAAADASGTTAPAPIPA